MKAIAKTLILSALLATSSLSAWAEDCNDTTWSALAATECRGSFGGNINGNPSETAFLNTTWSSLVGGSFGTFVLWPAGLGGYARIAKIDLAGTLGTELAIDGASTLQAQSDWVTAVGSGTTLWLTTSGYYGAGGSRKTDWIPVELASGGQASAASYEYYGTTVAVTAATCPR